MFKAAIIDDLKYFVEAHREAMEEGELREYFLMTEKSKPLINILKNSVEIFLGNVNDAVDRAHKRFSVKELEHTRETALNIGSHLPFPITLFSCTIDVDDHKDIPMAWLYYNDQELDKLICVNLRYENAPHLKCWSPPPAVVVVGKNENEIEVVSFVNMTDAHEESVNYTHNAFAHDLVLTSHVLEILECKNIELVELQSKHKRRHAKKKEPSVVMGRYHIINLKPFETQKKNKRNSSPTGIKQAFHIKRGHFKTYTEEAPLMGKHVGKYWWASHTAGSKDVGIINSDYKVEL